MNAKRNRRFPLREVGGSSVTITASMPMRRFETPGQSPMRSSMALALLAQVAGRRLAWPARRRRQSAAHESGVSYRLALAFAVLFLGGASVSHAVATHRSFPHPPV